MVFAQKEFNLLSKKKRRKRGQKNDFTFLMASSQCHKTRRDKVVKVSASTASDALFSVVET